MFNRYIVFVFSLFMKTSNPGMGMYVNKLLVLKNVFFPVKIWMGGTYLYNILSVLVHWMNFRWHLINCALPARPDDIDTISAFLFLEIQVFT